MIRYAALGAAIAIFVASLGTIGYRLVSIEQDVAGDFGENLVWAMAQNEIESLRFLALLERFGDGDPGAGHGELERRFELLWSRLEVVRQGELAARLARVEGAREPVDATHALLVRLDPLVQALRPGDRETAKRIADEIAAATPRLHEATLASAHAELARLAAIGEERRGAMLEGLYYLLALLASAAILVALLVAELARSRRLAAAAREAEALARDNEQRFRDIAESASDWIWETGPDHRFTFLSAQLRDLSGEAPEPLIGRTRFSLRLPEDRDDANWERHRGTVERHLPFRGFTFPYADSEGQRRSARVHGKPRFAGDGSFLGYRGVGRDITAELAAAEAVAESQRLLRAVIDAVPAVINVKDRGARYVLMNRFQGRVYGVDPEEAIGRLSADLVGAVYGGRSREMDQRVIESGRAIPFCERDFVDVNGEPHTWWTAKEPLLDQDGQVRYVVTVALDITRLKATEQARNNLSRYFSPNMVELLAASDQEIRFARQHDVAVVFSDIVDFTGLCAREPPERIFELLRDYHRRLTRIVFDHGGTLDKYLGDGLMATFGTPRPGPLDASNALACVSAMVAEVDSWNRARSARGESRVAVGFGAHFGPVLLGNIGNERRLEFAVVGDTVNVASRLEGLTRRLGVPAVVSQTLIDAAARETANASPCLANFVAGGVHEIPGRLSSIAVRTWAAAQPAAAPRVA